jgi:hypothetical protein
MHKSLTIHLNYPLSTRQLPSLWHIFFLSKQKLRMEKIEELVPGQEKGGKTDTEHEIEFATEEEAKRHFIIAKERLQDVNRWHEMAGSLTAGFNLTDESGEEVTRPAKTGDYFRIKIPAPGPGSGDGYDWVRVEVMEDQTSSSADEDAFGIRVRPAEQPGKNKPEDVAHFFKDDATSSFIVERKGRLVKAAVHGRNEVPNTTAEKPLDKARNAVVALGAMAGLSNPQWKSLVKGILNFK